MTLEQAGSFAVAAGILTLLPGSDTLLVLRNALLHGRATGMVVTVGICSGLFVHATVSALGIAAVVRHVPHGFLVLQALGAAYLGVLGLRSLRWAAHPPSAADPDGPAPVPGAPGRAKFVEGFLANVLNPKAMVFYMALLPQFVAPTDPVWTTSMGLAAIHCVEGIAWLGFLVAAMERARPVLSDRRVLRILEGTGGALLVGFAARLALARI